jgi:hypothetical protein
MSDYENHIFVSYRRADEDWVRWTRENFERTLGSLLRPALGEVHIFVDEQIETGMTWPARLAQALARSRLLIPVLSRSYFLSAWCRLELAIMYDREQKAHLRTAANPWGLIIPVVIDDGDHFPPEIRQIQADYIHDFANPFIRFGSPKQQAFAERLHTKLCPSIQAALGNVPPFDPDWEQINLNQFEKVFLIKAVSQTVVPHLSLGVQE